MLRTPFQPDVHISPTNESYYQARFISAGPDVAIELAPDGVRSYINGTVRDDMNAFTQYVSNRGKLLTEARRRLIRADTDTVIIVGRWNRPDFDEGLFDAYILHIVSESGVQTWPYRIAIFQHDSHETAMSIKAPRIIDERFKHFLQRSSKDLTRSMRGDLTRYGIPHVDGVAWVPNDNRFPTIICHLDWPERLDRTIALDTLELTPSPRRNQFSLGLKECASLGDIMAAARIPMYFFQIRQEEAHPYEPIACHFDNTRTDRAAVLLTRVGSQEDGEFNYASDWHSPEGESGIEYRILA